MNSDVDLKDGIPIDKVEETTFTLSPGQAALALTMDEAVLFIPESNDSVAEVPQHVLVLIGVYFMTEDPAFVEKAIRVAIDRLTIAREQIEAEPKRLDD